MKAWVWLAAILVMTAGAARAEPSDWTVALTDENDVFNPAPDHSDRYYTQGLQIAVMSPALPGRSFPAAIRMTCFLESFDPGCRGGNRDVRLRWGLEIGQNIFTPELKKAIPDPGDRPYAGWLYAGALFGSYSEGEANTLEVQVGVVGPHAYGGEVQSFWHTYVLNHAAIFEGWNHQLKDEVAFVVIGERRQRPHRIWTRGADPDRWAIDSTNYVDFAAGTLRDSIGAGRTLRVGYGLGSDYGPPRIRPAPSGSVYIEPTTPWSAYLFAGVDGQAVARDIFLDGNTFVSSPRVNKRWLVAEAMAGAELRWLWFRVGYTYVWRTEEFYAQRGPQRFGSWSVSFAPCRILPCFRR